VVAVVVTTPNAVSAGSPRSASYERSAVENLILRCSTREWVRARSAAPVHLRQLAAARRRMLQHDSEPQESFRPGFCGPEWPAATGKQASCGLEGARRDRRAARGRPFDDAVRMVVRQRGQRARAAAPERKAPGSGDRRRGGDVGRRGTQAKVCFFARLSGAASNPSDLHEQSTPCALARGPAPAGLFRNS